MIVEELTQPFRSFSIQSPILSKIVQNITVQNSKLKRNFFDPTLIRDSLLLETDLSEENAIVIALKATKFIVSLKLPYLTAPMIREIVCVVLLQSSFLKERYQYTRLGIPYFNYKQMIENNELKEQPSERLSVEYNEVTDRINEI